MMSSRLPHGQRDEPPAAISLVEFCQVSRQSGSRLAVTDAAKRIPIKVLMLSHSRKLVNFAPALLCEIKTQSQRTLSCMGVSAP